MKKNVNIEFEASKDLAAPVKGSIEMDLVEVPALPTEDGNYQLTVASGVYTWAKIV